MNLDLKPDERILAYGIASLVLAFIFGPVGLFVGLRTRTLARDTAAEYRSAEPDGLNPDFVKIGYWLGIAGIVIGGVYTGLLCLSLLIMLGVGTMAILG